MKYNDAFFDQPISRFGTACEKWDGIKETEGRELLPMWVADMDFRCAKEITDALMRRAEHPVYGYTYQRDSAVEAMLDYMRRWYGVSLTEQQQIHMPCVITGMKAAVLTLTEPGDTVLIQPPVYGPFFSSVLKNKRKVERNPLLKDEHGRYTMNYDLLEEQLKRGVKLMMICSPHNPVGRVWSEEELQTLYRLCKQYGTILVSDEIHAGFVYEQSKFTSVLKLDEDEDANLVVLSSATKTFNIAGLRQAVILTRNQKLKGKLSAFLDHVGAEGGDIFAMEANEAAYRYGDPWLKALLTYLDKSRKLVAQELKQRLPETILSPIEATYLGWMDLNAYGLSSKELMEATHEEGVAFTDGQFFDKDLGNGFLRINFACPRSQTITAIELLQAAIIKRRQ